MTSFPLSPLGSAAAALRPSGCSTGFVTGTVIDTARCVVVELDLRSNNLTGAFNISSIIALLPNLQVLRLDNNSIDGTVPVDILTSMLRMDTIGLSANRFSYKATAEAVFTHCAPTPQYGAEAALLAPGGMLAALDEVSTLIGSEVVVLNGSSGPPPPPTRTR